jgi:hypothetical protein
MWDQNTSATPQMQGHWPQIDAEKLQAFDVRAGQTEITLNAHIYQRVERHIDGTYVAVGTLPTTHPYYTDSPDQVRDPLFLAEFIRQGVEVIARTFLNVPEADHLILKDIDLVLDPAFLLTPDRNAVDIRVSLQADQLRCNRRGRIYAIDGPFVATIGGTPAATYDGTIAFIAPDVFGALRGGKSAPPFGDPVGYVEPQDAGSLGKKADKHVLIGSAAARRDGHTAVILPQARPPFYDRPLDHYPGMVMAEAARQLVTRTAYLTRDVMPHEVRIGAVKMDFQAFAECDTPPILRAVATTRTPRGQWFDVTVSQADQTRAVFTIETCFSYKMGVEQ